MARRKYKCEDVFYLNVTLEYNNETVDKVVILSLEESKNSDWLLIQILDNVYYEPKQYKHDMYMRIDTEKKIVVSEMLVLKDEESSLKATKKLKMLGIGVLGNQFYDWGDQCSIERLRHELVDDIIYDKVKSIYRTDTDINLYVNSYKEMRLVQFYMTDEDVVIEEAKAFDFDDDWLDDDWFDNWLNDWLDARLAKF